MAEIGPRFSRARPQYAQRVYLTRLVGNQLIASAWPTPKGGRLNARQRVDAEVFRARLYFCKRMHGREVRPMLDALNRFLRRNRGLRGSAAIRWRDLCFQVVSGRLWAFSPEGWPVLYTWSVRREQTQIMDWFEPFRGSILTNTSNGWLPTSGGNVGAVLTVTPSTTTGNCPFPAKKNLNNPL